MDGTPTLDQSASPEATSAPVETDQTVDLNIQTDAASEQQTPEPVVPDLDEIEYEGEKFSIPKKLKNGFLMQSDYTRKTQEVAAERKALEAQKEQATKQAEATQAHLIDVAKVVSLNERLAEFDKIDWAALDRDDPIRAGELFRQRSLMKEQRDGLAQQIQTKESQRSQEAQQSFAKRYAETNETLAKDITGWNQDLANKLADFAKANGVTDDELRTLAVSAPLVKLLHKASLTDQLIAKTQTAAKAAEPKVEPKPLTKVSGTGARAAVSLADADMDTYVAERKKQGFGKR